MGDFRRTDIEQLRESGTQFTLIDVREPWEHEEYNIGGKNLPLGNIQEWISDLENLKSNKIVMYCRSGARSGMATSFMAAQGFQDVHNLAGGVIAWQAEE